MAAATVCRICLNTSSHTQSIFSKPKMTRKTVPEIVLYVSGIQIEEHDGLPHHICVDCINLAQSASLFKDLCVQSELKLKGKPADNFSLLDVDTQAKHAEKSEYVSPDGTVIKEEKEILVSDSETPIKNETNGALNNGSSSSDIKPYQCAFCISRFDNCTELKLHVQEEHTQHIDGKEREKIKNPCQVCGRLFNSTRNLNSHVTRCQARSVKVNRMKIIKEEIVTSDSDTPLSENFRRESSDNDNGIDIDITETEFLKNELEEIDLEDKIVCQTRGETKKRSHRCEECDLSLSSKQYNLHMKKIHSKKKAVTKRKKTKKSTESAQEEYPAWLEISKTEVDLINPVIYPCTKCERKFNKQESLLVHLKRHEALTEQIHTCPMCKREFKRKAHLDNHVLTHAVDRGFQCSECPKSFARQDSLQIHMEHHKGVKRHQCKFCDKGFNMSSTLRDHVRTHTGEKPFLCSICGRGFSQSTNLKEHLRRHQGYKPFKCEHCDQTFVSKGELEAHTRKHSGAHPFVCDVCGGGFTTSSSLVKHKRIHTGERPYQCDFCPLRFTALGTLKNHRRTHTGEKPYKCDHCEKAFAQKNDLVSHRRTHTGERPYVCSVCGHAFRQSSALKTHLKVHGDPPTESKPFAAEGKVFPIPVPQAADGNRFTVTGKNEGDMLSPKSESTQ